MARDYKKEYAEYQGRPDQIAKRAMRNKARSDMEKAGRVSKGDGMEVDHKKGLRFGTAGANAKSNLRVKTRAANRGWRDGKV